MKAKPLSKLSKGSSAVPEKVSKAIMFLAQSGYLGYLFGMATNIRDKDLFRLSILANVVQGAGLVFAFIYVVSMHSAQPDPLTFGLTRDLRVVKMTPLNEEFIDHADLNNWAAETAVQTLSLSFTHFKQQLNSVRDRFFDESFKQVLASLESSQFLPTIRGDGNTEPANSNATLIAPAVITGKGLVDGVMNWRIEFPIIINFEFRGGKRNTQKRLVIMIVQRVPEAEHPRGVKIRQFNLELM